MRILDNALCWIRRKACVQLHIPHCEVWLTLEFFDEQGNLTKKRRQRAKSWVKNAYTAACISMMDTLRSTSCSAGTTGLNATSGGCISNENNFWSMLPRGNQLSTNTGDNCTLRGATAEATRGIVIGRGTTAESFTQFSLATALAHGYGTNQACFQLQDQYTVSYNAGTKTMTAKHSRVYNNNSDSDITLTETGLYGTSFAASAYSRASYMTCRDLLSPAETFKDKAQLRVTYEISLAYPA